jgi:hypothetical protein
MDQKTKELNWLIGKRSYLSIDKKLLIYKTVIRPIWTYGIELWDCASKTKIAIIQNTPIHHECTMICIQPLKSPYVTETIRENSTKHYNKLENHSNLLLQPLLQPHENRRLQRNWPADLRN